MSYVMKKEKDGNRYWYIRRLPKGCTLLVYGGTIRVSLWTNNKREADRISNKFNDELERLFTDVRMKLISIPDAKLKIKKILDIHGVEEIAEEFKVTNACSEYKKTNGQSWDKKGQVEFERSVKYFTESVDDLPLRLIDRNTCTTFRDHIKATGASLETVNKHITRMSAVFKYMKLLGKISDNPCDGIKYKINKKEKIKSKYLPFSSEDIKHIWDVIIKNNGAEPNKYWIPLLGMFTGARKNEICELRKSDVKKIGGHFSGKVDCISFTETEEGRSVKTSSSIRTIPIHSKLIELGFLKFVENRPDGPLFDLSESEWGGRGHNYSWFMKQLRKYTKDKQKAFHSWRSTVASRLNDAGVPSTHRADILGHERKSDTETDKTYTSFTQLWTLKTAIENLKYPEIWPS